MTKFPSSALPPVAAPAQPLLESEVVLPSESVLSEEDEPLTSSELLGLGTEHRSLADTDLGGFEAEALSSQEPDKSHESHEPHEPHHKAEESSDLAASLERLTSWAELSPAPSNGAESSFAPPPLGVELPASPSKSSKAPSFGGEVFSYFSICKRKCWLHAHQIHLQQESEAVALGKLLHQISFPRENQKEFAIEGAKIDFLDASSVVHEIKSSDRFEEAHISQVKFYLYLLLLRGFPSPQGCIHYPKLKKTVDVELTDDDRRDIQEKIQEIQSFLRLEKPPKAPQTALCRKCSYEEFCWG